MTIDQAQWVVGAIGSYGLVGLLFALAFVARGVDRIDPSAKGMPLMARLLLVSGAAALWPLMLAKWWRHRTPSNS